MHLHTQLSALHAHHLTSALAVALRKLNTSYGKRTKDLDRERRERREERAEWEAAKEGWEEEREEGWKVAVEVGARLDREREEWQVEREEWAKEKEGWRVQREKWEGEREAWRREREAWERQRGGWEMERREWEDERGWWSGERRRWEGERRELVERVEALKLAALSSGDVDTPAVEEAPSELPPQPPIPIRIEASVQTDPLPLISAPAPSFDPDANATPTHANIYLHAHSQSQSQRTSSDSWESTIDGHSFRDNASINTQDLQVVDVMGTAVASKARLTMIPSPRLGEFAGQQRGQGEGAGEGGKGEGGEGGEEGGDKPPPVPPKSSVPPSSYPSTSTSQDKDQSSIDPKTPTSKLDRRLSTSSQVSQVSLVSAARKRSMRASKASLRIPARVTAKVNANARSQNGTMGGYGAASPVTDSPTLGGSMAAGISGSPVVQSSLWNHSTSDNKEGADGDGDGDEVKSVRSRRARSRSRSRSRAEISGRVPSVLGKRHGHGNGHRRGRSRGGSLGGISASEMPPLPGGSTYGEGAGAGVGVGGGKERERVVSVDGVSMKGKGKGKRGDMGMEGEGDEGEEEEDGAYMSFLELGGRALELESELGKGGAEKEVSGTSSDCIFIVFLRVLTHIN